FFLHAYQPPIPVQTVEVIERLVQVSYIPLTNAFVNNPEIKLTLNINASLTEMLVEYGDKVLENICQLAESNQIEFVESGAYHPILPLISPKYQKIQLDLNNKINRKLLGSHYKPVGVFPPELALNNTVAKFLSELNYKYSIASEPTFPFGFKQGLPYFMDFNKKFFIIRRNRYISNDLAFRKYKTPEAFLKVIKQHSKGEIGNIPIIGMDFETFGEHHRNYHNFLLKSLKKMNVLTINDYIELLEQENESFEISFEEIRASSWSTEDYEVQNKIPYPLWDHPSNSLHQLILTLMEILEQALQWIEPTDRLMNFYKSQQSCQLWWCADGRFGPDIIRRASSFQLKTLKEIGELAETYTGNRREVIEILITIAQRINNRIEILLNKRSK
ncbi:MAG: hypothetical protein ACXAC7_11840, partial [Candidatus Hodarchaeales archaeon]